MKKTYLITGGTGSFGKAFSEKLTEKSLRKESLFLVEMNLNNFKCKNWILSKKIRIFLDFF